MKTLVLVPTYNERENIPILVKDILQVPGTVVMVLDDQSPDGTGAVADALAGEYPGRVQVLHRTGQRGLGVSYLEGFQRRDQRATRTSSSRWTPTCRTIRNTFPS